MKELNWKNTSLVYFLLPLALFFFSLTLRLEFYCGFILGDDRLEFQYCQYIFERFVEFDNNMHRRFGGWVFNVLAFALMGVNEFSFFVPTILMSTSLSVVGYALLLRNRWEVSQAFLSSLVVAAAPFEVLIGTVRANDLILAWVLAVALLLLLLLEKAPRLQGFLCGILLWFAFNVKLWAVYLFPALLLYFILQFRKTKKLWSPIYFIAISAVLHGLTLVYWKGVTGHYLPFIHDHSATYPVPDGMLTDTFLAYPRQIFTGSHLQTILFGSIPYLLVAGLAVKSLAELCLRKSSSSLRLDRLDCILFCYYISFFLLLNFFPNSFTFDKYYSAPRIFRYLAPLSFPMTLHAVKLVFDFVTALPGSALVRKSLIGTAFFLLMALNLHETTKVTEPGRVHYYALQQVIKDLKQERPQFLLSGRIGTHPNFFFRYLYLEPVMMGYNMLERKVDAGFKAKEHEQWLEENQESLSPGTMMLTGLCSYVFYGAHDDGFRLSLFDNKLHPGWKLYKEYNDLSYLHFPEKARLWKWLPDEPARD